MELHSALALFLAILTGLLVKALLTRGTPGLPPPPCIRGWIPWLGASLQMGKAPLAFIEEARRKHGPVFTIMAAGKRLTFVSGDEGVSAFFKSKQVNFPQAVQKAVEHTASIGEKIFYQFHEDILKMMAFRLSHNRLNEYTSRLGGEFTLRLDQLSSQGTTELYNLVRQVIYPAVVDILFGKGLCPTTKDKIKEFEEHFRTFDEGFEYGSQLPEWFFKDWSLSKQWLLKLFKNIIRKAEESKLSEGKAETLLHHLLDTVKGNSTNNYCLLLLWASQANANPVTFWTLAFIISKPEVYKKVMSQITSAFGNGGQHHLNITATDLKNIPYVKSCVLETIRLRSPGAIARKVAKPLKVHNYEVPPGDLLMLSPYWVHRDPKYFPDPETFKPERWSEETLEKNVFLPGFMAFGGGKNQCPGRWFAIMEIHMLVILFLYKYEFQLLDPIPKQSNLHLVGTQQPDGPCRVKYKLRE